MIWQNSETRKRPDITTNDFTDGNKKIQPNLLSSPPEYDRVALDYLHFLPLQEKLFSNLAEKLKIYVDNDEKYLRRNGLWRNWGFRGYRMKIVPGDYANFLWEIQYNKPEKLMAFSYDGSNRTELGYFDILETKYFDKDPDEQNQLLDNFINYTLVRRL